jgi:ZIP family zinc transporter
MTIQQILSSVQTAQRTHATPERVVGVAGVVALGGLSVLAYSVGVTWKLLAISWVAFAAMAIGAPLGAQTAQTAQPVETV